MVDDPMMLPFRGLQQQPKQLEHYSHDEIFAEYQKRWIDDPEGMQEAVRKSLTLDFIDDGLSIEREREDYDKEGFHGGSPF